MRLRTVIFVFLLLLVMGCMTKDEPTEAVALAQRYIIADTHIDVPYRLKELLEDVSQSTENGDFDYPRAREGGLDLIFMSIYIPPESEATADGKALGDELIDLVEGIAAEHPDKFVMVSSPTAARNAFAAGKIGFAMGIENGTAFDGDLENLQYFFDRGVRYVGLAHSKANRLSDSSYDDEHRWEGLSPQGEQAVLEMNRLGMMIDLSHLSDQAVDDVLRLSQAPVIASHSSCRHFTPDWERNLDDARIQKLAALGGVIQINFGSSFINGDYQKKRSAQWDAVQQYREDHALEKGSVEAEEARKTYFAEHPLDHADVSEVAAHIDHVVKLVGIDFVGLGSDFDGVGDSLPVGLKDVSDYPNLIGELLKLGYPEGDIEKVLSGNLLRVWSEVEQRAEKL
jgi:membrane dipeptidase